LPEPPADAAKSSMKVVFYQKPLIKPVKEVVITSLVIIFFDDRVGDDNFVISKAAIIVFDDGNNDDISFKGCLPLQLIKTCC
jgi:hypothetical protein